MDDKEHKERLEQLRKAISDGNYPLDSQCIARAIIQHYRPLQSKKDKS